MEALLLLAALLIVVALPQIIVDLYSKRDSLTLVTKLDCEEVYLKNSFKVTYSAYSENDNIKDLIPPEFKDVKVVSGPIYSNNKNGSARVLHLEYRLQSQKAGEIQIQPAAILLSDDTLYHDKKSQPIKIDVKHDS